MSDPMVLDHAILGLLHGKPLTGYEIKRRFDGSIRHFWTADQSHIYRVLARLEKGGYVSCEPIPQEGKPNRKVYTITASGTSEFRRWLAAGEARATALRSPYLVELFFSGHLSNEQVLKTIAKDIAQSEEELKTYEDIAAKSLAWAEDHPTRAGFFSHLTLDYGQWMTNAFLEWIGTVRNRVERGDPDCADWHQTFTSKDNTSPAE